MEKDGPQPIQVFNPASFVERGIALPFTSPLLAGTRVRPKARNGIEMVVPNPAAGRGCYILDWPSTITLCRPTVHDHRLVERISKLHTLTPRLLRDAACEVAGSGFAGRETARAAEAATRQSEQECMVTNYHLLLALVAQVGGSGLLAEAGGPVDPAQAEPMAKRAIAAVAPTLQSSPAALTAALAELASLFAMIGFGTSAPGARLQQLMTNMETLRADMETWRQRGRPDARGAAEMIGAVVETTLHCARSAVQRARAEGADIIQMLRRWIADPKPLAAMVSRPDWVLDGWETICGLWLSASNNMVRRERLDEIIRLLPVVPKEIFEWIDGSVDVEAAFRRGRNFIVAEDWCTGTRVIELTARNEQLLGQVLLRDRSREVCTPK